MCEDENGVEVYQAHVWIRRISPMIWRRLLVRSDSTIADLHCALQIAIDWSDLHLHRFHIHGQDYGISRIGGPGFSSDPRKVHLGDFKFRINERFLYEYDFGSRWEHEVRIERRLPVEAKKIYPVCVGGWRAGPEEDCGGWSVGVHGTGGPSLVPSTIGGPLSDGQSRQPASRRQGR